MPSAADFPTIASMIEAACMTDDRIVPAYTEIEMEGLKQNLCYRAPFQLSAVGVHRANRVCLGDQIGFDK